MPPAAVCQMQARARTLTQADLPLSVLSREDTLAYLLVHGAKHKWATLKLVLDLDVVVRNQLPVDWEAFTHIMMELQLQRPLVQGFGLAQRVFATPIPGPVRRIMDEQPGAAYLVESAYRALLADKDYLKVAGPFTEFKQALYMAQLRPGWRYRISFLTSFLLHSLNDWNDYPLPDSLFVLYYLMRPFTWVWRYFIRRAVRSNLVA